MKALPRLTRMCACEVETQRRKGAKTQRGIRIECPRVEFFHKMPIMFRMQKYRFSRTLREVTRRKSAEEEGLYRKCGEILSPFCERSSRPPGKEVFFKKAKKLQIFNVSPCFLKKHFLPGGHATQKGRSLRFSVSSSPLSVRKNRYLQGSSVSSLRLCVFAPLR